ncbi:MAG: outer membrane lipoprotein carrier protein LolA [candidate division KSB1 bacterium]|nr:outer membrane lipoprotein carrier protein LolA [candidate division KSB1 bacterium]MDZ7304612.1 outer membrane lipoprotein carrier protein LolA [candidate division KSB1 bacterium]MDZ7313745.1 outer membrane lipoprotein carrier protein LolA [candidate division KSB1 bacterium]
MKNSFFVFSGLFVFVPRFLKRKIGEGEKVFLALFTAVCAILASSTAITFAQEKAEDIVAKIRQTYEKLESLKGDFEQQYTWSLAGETQVLNGTLYLKKGDRYRVETQNQMIITDGKTVWTYSPDKMQVIVDRLEKSKDNPLPRDLVIKYTRDFKPRLLRSEKIGAADCHVIALSPRDENSFIHGVTAWIDKSTWLAVRIEQIDINDNKTVYLLKNPQRNVPLADALFTFDIPADAEVVDMR